MPTQPTMQFLLEDENRASRWSHLTENMNEDKYMKAVVETLLDNTKYWAEQASNSQNVTQFTTYAFPLIRRIFPQLIANELVSIQPLTMPSGMIFYFDLKYGTDVSPTQAGDRMDWQAGKFNAQYASGRYRNHVIGTGDGTNKAFVIKNVAPVELDSVVGYVNSTLATVADVAIEGEDVKITMAVAPAAGASVAVDFNQHMEGNNNAPEVTFDMASDTISTEQKRLKAKWTLESQQDLFAYHGLDAEAELTAVLADEIRREIDRIIIDDLFAGASAGNVNWSQTAPVGFEGSSKEYQRTFMEAIVDANTLIYNKRLVNANFIVAHPNILARLEKSGDFRYNGDLAGGDIQKGANVFGTLSSKYRVIADPMAPQNKLLLGYRGTSFFETGYVYAPYQPLYTTPTIIDTDFTPRKAVMTRFGRKLVSGDFYATVTITA